jgi:hypothetical protein
MYVTCNAHRGAMRRVCGVLLCARRNSWNSAKGRVDCRPLWCKEVYHVEAMARRRAWTRRRDVRTVEARSSNAISSISAEAEFTSNVDAVIFVGDALVANRSVAFRRTRTYAHLPALIVHGSAGVAVDSRVGCGAIKLVLDEDVMRVLAAGSKCCLVDDAGPDSGERQEDADDGKDDYPELGGIGPKLQ